MGEALAAGYDLAGILACFVAVGFLLLVAALVKGLFSVLDVGIGPWHPFHGVINKAENAITGAINDVIKGLEAQATKFEHGVTDALELIIGIPLVLAVALEKLLAYLWHSALGPFVHSITDTIATTASQALTTVTTLTNTVADNLTAAKNYAAGQATKAENAAESYASHWIDNAVSVLGARITAAIAAAEGYADSAIARLKSLEDAAVSGAVSIAVDAKNAGINAAASALTTAEGYTDAAKGAAIAAAAGALTTAESYADAANAVAIAATGGALLTAEGFATREANAAAAGAEAFAAQAAGAVSSALDTVRSVAVGAADDLATIEGSFGVIGLAALIASIPAIATLTNAIATETGLENPDCRQKVKGICATPSNVWEDLLGGLLATGFAFSLLELAQVADPILVQLAPIIVEAA